MDIPKRSIGVFSIVAAIPWFAMAHTRWFAEDDIPPLAINEPTALYYLAWIVAVFAFIAGCIYAERKGFFQLDFLTPRRDHAYPRAAATFSMITGAFLMIAGTHGYFFSPNITVAGGMPNVLIVLQVLIGITLLTGVYARIVALCLAFLWMSGFFYTETLFMLENIWVLSTALFIFIMGSDYFSLVPLRSLSHLTRRFHEYSLPILRIGTGTTLIILGFSEKILRPELGVNFLAQHHWNFMQILGFEWYSDYLFTISAGAVESFFGLIFILGIVTRMNALVLAVFFTIPLFILGPIELAGHLPHFAAVVILLLFGGGERLRFNRIFSAAHR